MIWVQELAAVVRDPASALFQQVPEDSGLYQPSEKAHVQSDTMDVVLMYRSLGVVVAKAVAARACFPLRFTQYALPKAAGVVVVSLDVLLMPCQLSFDLTY